MKQRSQILSETAHTIKTHTEAIREALTDLETLGIDTGNFEIAVAELTLFRIRLTSPAPNTAVGTRHECYNASVDAGARWVPCNDPETKEEIGCLECGAEGIWTSDERGLCAVCDPVNAPDGACQCGGLIDETSGVCPECGANDTPIVGGDLLPEPFHSIADRAAGGPENDEKPPCVHCGVYAPDHDPGCSYDSIDKRIKEFRMTKSDWQLYSNHHQSDEATAALNHTLQGEFRQGTCWTEVQARVRKVMELYVHTGACDTEPDCVLCDVLETLYDLPCDTVTR